MNLRVRRLRPEAVLPRRAHAGDAGLDLHATEEAELAPGGRARVVTGVAIEIPSGHAGWILPRSGLAHEHGLALVNAPGLIDPGYRGELAVLLLNTGDRPFHVHAGMRIAQLVIAAVELPEIVEVDALTESARGEGGFGSSGH